MHPRTVRAVQTVLCLAALLVSGGCYRSASPEESSSPVSSSFSSSTDLLSESEQETTASLSPSSSQIPSSSEPELMPEILPESCVYFLEGSSTSQLDNPYLMKALSLSFFLDQPFDQGESPLITDSLLAGLADLSDFYVCEAYNENLTGFWFDNSTITIPLERAYYTAQDGGTYSLVTAEELEKTAAAYLGREAAAQLSAGSWGEERLLLETPVREYRYFTDSGGVFTVRTTAGAEPVLTRGLVLYYTAQKDGTVWAEVALYTLDFSQSPRVKILLPNGEESAFDLLGSQTDQALQEERILKNIDQLERWRYTFSKNGNQYQLIGAKKLTDF